VIHDLNFEHFPEDLPYLERNYYKYYFPRFARKAKRIATVSEYSKGDIASLYGISPKKVDVVYNGANESFSPVDSQTSKRVIDQYTDSCPYFVFVGSLHPRKNLDNLFKAYDQFREMTDRDVKLVIVGAKKWWTKKIKETYQKMKYQSGVVFTGRVNVDELKNLISSALAMTYVSSFEGFGIPITESFYCGTPVITSNVTSMPEVAGDAALLVDPYSPTSIAEAMFKIATDESFRQSLIKKGHQRKLMFSWQKSADRLWNSIVKAVEA